jgi:hypothetical protein
MTKLHDPDAVWARLLPLIGKSLPTWEAVGPLSDLLRSLVRVGHPVDPAWFDRI